MVKVAGKQLCFILFLFMLQFDTNTYQIGVAKSSLTSPVSCNLEKYNGTTRNLKEIFIGRCYYFLNYLQKDNCDFQNTSYNCEEIWKVFYELTTKVSCKIDDFDPLLQLTDHPIKENQSVFWSGTYTPAHQYTITHRFWSLEDTLNGYLLNELNFCNDGEKYIVNASCPYDCTFWTFWYAASRNFARKARGSVLVILNGSRREAIMENSTFSLVELPEIIPSRINKVTVLLLHSPSLPKIETCKSGNTISKLRNEIMSRNIDFECCDDPQAILFFMCFQDPFSKECEIIKLSINNANMFNVNNMLLTFSVVIVYIIHLYEF